MKLKERISNLLGRFPDYRCSDRKLLCHIWFEDLPEFLKGREVRAFLEYYASGKLASSESVRRMRQKIQEEYKHLRGDNYSERKRKGEATREKISTEKAESECPGYCP